MAQEALAEVVVAGVGCGRKKKRLQRREKGWKEKRKSCGGSLVVGWWLCWLPVVELVVALVGGWNGGEREGEKKLQKRGQRGWFLADFGPDFSSLRA